MNQLTFCKPNSVIYDCAIALEERHNGFITAPPNEAQQTKIASYARDCSGTIVAGILAKQDSKVLSIQGLWVANAIRSCGTGSKLLQLLEQYAQQNHITSIMSETTQVQLAHFYLKKHYKLIHPAPPKLIEGKHYLLEKVLQKAVHKPT